MSEGSEAKGRRPVKFSCGTPSEFCKGHKCSDVGRYHDCRADVLACQRRYLLKSGATQITSRSFALPNDGPILVLSKKPQRVKPGKTNNQYMAQSLKVRDSTPARSK